MIAETNTSTHGISAVYLAQLSCWETLRKLEDSKDTIWRYHDPRKQAFKEVESPKRSLSGEIHLNLLFCCSWSVLLIPKMRLRIHDTKQEAVAKQLNRIPGVSTNAGPQVVPNCAPREGEERDSEKQTWGSWGTPRWLCPNGNLNLK